MASIFEQYGIKEVADVTFYEIDSLGRNKPVLYIDTAKMSTIEKTASTAEARGGKANPALISWDFGLEINVTLEDALFSAKSMAIMQGSGKVVEGSASAPVYVDVTNEAATIEVAGGIGTLTLKHSAKPESLYIYYIDDNGRWIDGQQLHNWTAIPGTNNKQYTCSDSKYVPEVSSDVVVFYKTPIASNSAQVIKINSDTFPGTYRVVGDTYARNRSTGKDEYFQFCIHRAKMQSENTITLSADGDPSTFNMSLKVLRNIKDSGMIDLIKYDFDDVTDEDAEDYNASTEGAGSYTAALRSSLNTLNADIASSQTLYALASADLAANYETVYSVSTAAATSFSTAIPQLNDARITAVSTYDEYKEYIENVGYTQSELETAKVAVDAAEETLSSASELVSARKVIFDSYLGS